MMQVPHWSRGLVPTHLQTLLHLEVHSNAPREGQESSSTVGRWSSGDRDVREIPSNHTVTFPSGSAGKESARNAPHVLTSHQISEQSDSQAISFQTSQQAATFIYLI